MEFLIIIIIWLLLGQIHTHEIIKGLLNSQMQTTPHVGSVWGEAELIRSANQKTFVSPTLCHHDCFHEQPDHILAWMFFV